MSSAPQADLDLERRQGRLIGLIGILAVFVEFAALIIALSAIQSGPGGRASRGGHEASQYMDFDKHKDLALLASGLKALGFVLLIVVGMYLFYALKARTPQTPNYILWLGIIGPILVGVVAILNFAAVSHIVNQFLDHGMRTNERAKNLADDYGFFRALVVVALLGNILTAAWLGALCAAGIATGILPKYVAYYGYGAAIATVLAPDAGLALLLGWLGSAALIALNKFPGGRPLAWETGRAEPLP